jgi:hypothetical protein
MILLTLSFQTYNIGILPWVLCSLAAWGGQLRGRRRTANNLLFSLCSSVKYFEKNPNPGLPDRDLKWDQQIVSI